MVRVNRCRNDGERRFESVQLFDAKQSRDCDDVRIIGGIECACV